MSFYAAAYDYDDDTDEGHYSAGYSDDEYGAHYSAYKKKRRKRTVTKKQLHAFLKALRARARDPRASAAQKRGARKAIETVKRKYRVKLGAKSKDGRRRRRKSPSRKRKKGRMTTNPETGRKIRIGGPTYKELRALGKIGRR